MPTRQHVLSMGRRRNGEEAMTNETILPELVGTLAELPEHIQKAIQAYGGACYRTALQSLPVQTSSTIRGDSYAGVYAWLGSSNIIHHLSRMSIEDARDDPQSILEHVAFHCIKQLEQYDIMQSPEVQELRKDAERYRWLKKQFEIMSRDMRYNQVWVLKRPIGSGQTMDEACDNAMKREE